MTPLFPYLDIETSSMCNRTCVACIRNSHPDRDALNSWFQTRLLPMNVIQMALEQAAEMGFTGGVCLSHYNEPLMDKRISEIARLAKSYGKFFVFLNTNGDFLTEELATELDGNLDRIIVTLYMDEPVKSKRNEWIYSLFHKTEVHTIIEHIHATPTHFSPKSENGRLATLRSGHPCTEPRMRVVINHRGQYLLCCEDVIGNFDLGTFPETSLKDFWFGEKHEKILATLADGGGRKWHSYCLSCPRP